MPAARCLFDGVDVTHLPIEQRNVGMVFQSYALFPNMTVAGNVGYGLRIRRVPDAQVKARVSEMLAMMQITRLADRRIDQLSGGQRQRVALARAIAVRPRALLLDEPLTALDAKLRDTLRLDIDSLLRSLGITAIYVTHDQAEAMALGDRIVVHGTRAVAQIGKPREIYQRPSTRFVADFIGTMNRLTARPAAASSAARPGPPALKQPRHRDRDPVPARRHPRRRERRDREPAGQRRRPSSSATARGSSSMSARSGRWSSRARRDAISSMARRWVSPSIRAACWSCEEPAMLIAQITDTHIKLPGKLATGRSTRPPCCAAVFRSSWRSARSPTSCC